jgi:hypothetical protein
MSKDNIRIKLDIDTGKAIANIQGVEKEFKDLNTAIKSTAAETKKMNDGAGLAGATVQALGQGVGDLRYGFGAVANNISQVGSLFGGLVAQTGSVTKAVKALRTAFMGPLGVLFAFQAAVAALDYFSSKQKEAEQNTDGLTDALKRQTRFIGELNDINGVSLQNTIKQMELEGKSREEILKATEDFYDNQRKYVQGFIDDNNEQINRLAVSGKAYKEGTNEFTEEYQKLINANESLKKKLNNIDNLKLAAQLNYQEESLKKYQEYLIKKQMLENTLNTLDEFDMQNQLDDFAGDFIGDVDNSPNADGDTSGPYDSSQDVEYQRLVDKYRTLNMTRLEQINYEEQIRLEELEGLEDYEDLKTKITDDAEKKRQRIRKLAQLQMLDAIGANFAAAASLMTDSQGKATAASKAINSASALISTYSSAAKAMEIYGPTPLGYLNASAATLQGLARVKAINSVKVPYGSGASGSTTGLGGNQGAQFDFNLVGQTAGAQGNQLLGNISQQGNEPIQAYVVQNDISTAQDLQDNIINNVTIGN